MNLTQTGQDQILDGNTVSPWQTDKDFSSIYMSIHTNIPYNDYGDVDWTLYWDNCENQGTCNIEEQGFVRMGWGCGLWA